MDSLHFGWEEWIGLPELGLPALKAKIDTGARTSALHAHDIEVFGPAAKPKVRFNVYPVAGQTQVQVTCSAPIKDRREVTSSNGESELRYVIETTLEVAGQSWPIEVTLTDRSGMTSRMLLGRQALQDHISITATEKRLQPDLSYDVYHSAAVRRAAPQRALRIAVLSREDNYSTNRLVEVGEARGHTVEVIDTTRCYMAINTMAPEVHYDGKRLPRYDAIVPRIGASITPYGTAVIRQFETIGTYCVNGSAGITASRDKLHAHQVLASKRIGMPTTAFAASPKDTGNLIGLVGAAPLIVKLLESTQGKGVVLAETKKAAESVIDAFRGLRANFLVQQFVKEAAGEDIRCLVIDGKVVASMKRTGAEGDFRSNLHRGGSAKTVRITKEERDTALRAARAFGLGKAGVDLLRSETGPKVLEVNSSPGFEGIEKATGKDIVGMLYDMIEARVKPQPVRKRKG
ncbi:30S ribosomal protein S6--L-glutamate ligase [Sulfitobacter pseudonitzschiae]|uniref:Probable alpha-L-glutamate ligase n=1 Tax=Pseudosulfitobacter pseudonitzschiae TaxID=1402135 RepID=A0A9Q2RZ07_9RHOB|nr:MULTISPECIES: 30S ribosomal protein S6--L-glutamate ligase [Roseobacteraceae]MBM2291114.1 30S ribosomal protein S6--L-glutamate ligase [Pseudosulfitobacter pseudonitzschiae]MBM2296032.1 30S ribosomal protein S6--L-glutamate ligase [Pseudosulfitobacter pseudonitzschiae]MBM2300945.1 30S ribosomal protein S6--L-glutamate ligase [Pseudosulfitobacter pseudonitzschiae]MBM2310729.1 30S ribosomal protein S6--L-glutamate ligase [Pseudosulfitobacter pseudonitzschiae]MBM2315642.1 30S ribosomal protein|tara:strand:+ start:1084 stop:2463 length:1380 start_codon:yes stop_codon:yes gene_type:complete